MAEQAHQPHAVFVRGPLRIGSHPPDAAPRRAVAHGEDDVGVAAVHDQEHGRSSPQRHGDAKDLRVSVSLWWSLLHPNSTFAAACAAPTNGAGKTKKNVVNSPVAAATNDSDAGRGSNGASGASKYIT